MYDNSRLVAIDVARNLIKDTVYFTEQLLSEGVGKVSVLFPNRRAVRFFEKFLSKKAFLRVNAFSLPDFLKNEIYAKNSNPPLYQNEIDRFFMILNIIKTKIPLLYQKLGNKEDRVYPWCVRISSLFNDFDRELIDEVKKIQYLDNIVDEAKEIMYQIDDLYKYYCKEMEENTLTFSGDMFKQIEKVKLSKNEGFVISGFVSITKGEKRLFKRMLENHKSILVFQTDLEKRHGDFNPYKVYDKWLDGSFWNSIPEKLKSNDGITKTKIDFFESFDVHSSCLQFGESLNLSIKDKKEESNPLKTAVVLPDENSLIPVIYSLPQCKINITMGFPFNKSTIAKIINELIELSLTYTEKGYYYKPLLKLLNHRLLQGMKFNNRSVSDLTERLAKNIELINLPFFKFDFIKNSFDFTEDEIEILMLLNKNLFEKFTKATSLKEIGIVLKDFLISIQDFLIEFETLKLERQMALNFSDNVLLKLMEAESSKLKFSSKEILYRILKSITENISIRFEGNPLEGVQIMGMLESRLLRFQTLFILDVNEGILPPDNKIDPLIPGIIKKEIGLPTYIDLENKYKYYFFRLIDSSENVKLFYQKGETNDEKKVRSRFIEQLLFQIEKEKYEEGKILKVKDIENNLIKTTSISVSSTPNTELFENIIGKCSLDFLNKSVSASAINNYMSCPLKYYLSNVLKIEEEKAISETQDPRNVGQIIHKLLENSFKKQISKNLDYKVLKQIEKEVFENLDSVLESELVGLSNLRINLLKQTAKYRLKTFFSSTLKDAKENTVTCLAVEKELTTMFEGIKISGIIDRIDYVENSMWSFIRVVDYKTGSYAKAPSKKMEDFSNSFDFCDYSKENQEKLYKNLVSIQLPLYNFLLENSGEYNTKFEEINSILYLLGVGSRESNEALFEGSSLSLSNFKKILKFILECMKSKENYYFVDSEQCVYCPNYKTCLFTTHKEK